MKKKSLRAILSWVFFPIFFPISFIISLFELFDESKKVLREEELEMEEVWEN